MKGTVAVVCTALGSVLVASPLTSQERHGTRLSLPQAGAHYGKWLTAGAAIAFTAMAAHEHSYSRRDWNDLLDFCHSVDDACTVGSDGRYLRYEAEFLYQRSLYYDRRANHRILGAQASLLVTAALFILDLRPGHDGPDNIPLSPLRVSAGPRGETRLGLQVSF